MYALPKSQRKFVFMTSLKSICVELDFLILLCIDPSQNTFKTLTYHFVLLIKDEK